MSVCLRIFCKILPGKCAVNYWKMRKRSRADYAWPHKDFALCNTKSARLPSLANLSNVRGAQANKESSSMQSYTVTRGRRTHVIAIGV